MIAGALLVGTALAGAVARGTIGAPATTAPVTYSAPPGSRVSFRGTLDRKTVLRGRDGTARIELAIAAAPDDAAVARRPTDVAIVLDRSGSMAGEKIEHARAAVAELLAALGPQDRFALVTYSDGAAVSIPLIRTTDAGEWSATVAGIQPEGGTNMASGLDLGLDLIGRVREDGRVPHLILISDGLANQGDYSLEGLTTRARRAASGEFMLSTIGVGADFNESLMSALADAGTGNYYYLRDAKDLGPVFAREFDAARTTVASGLAVEIRPSAGVQVLDAAGYPLERTGDAVVFRPGSLFAGQDRRIWVTLAVPNREVGEVELGKFTLSYGAGVDRVELGFAEAPRLACVAGEDDFYAGVDKGAWGRSVVVDSYNKMQEEVARDVKAGRKDAALAKVQQFRDETGAMNARIQSAPVAEQLKSADALSAAVSGAFVGDDQAAKQNELSKSSGMHALDARRAGSKK
jgi:Ca-activated chloride channel family protein